MLRLFSLPQEQVNACMVHDTELVPVILLFIRYGVGYHLTIVKDDSCDPSQVERAVRSAVSDAEQSTDVGAELSYVLPSSATGSFPQLFDKLEAEKAALGISSFGISVTTMEEVYQGWRRC